MKVLKSLLVMTVFAASSAVFAHSSVQKSIPANNSTITVAPKDLSLTFSAAVRLTALTVQSGDGKPQNLGPLPAAAAKSVTVPMALVSAGNYIVKWRAAGDDGHVMSGKVLFKFAPAPKAK
jgi:copper resistance protein C